MANRQRFLTVTTFALALGSFFSVSFACASSPASSARSTDGAAKPTAASSPTSTALKPSPPLVVHGHRGARARFPENSLPGFDHALEVGVDVLEMDLVVTRDDRLVVAHDPILAPHIVDLTGVDGTRLIRELTLEEVQRLQAGTTPHPRFPEQAIGDPQQLATLEDVFALVNASPHPAAKTVAFNIETKVVPGHPELAPDAATFARLLVDALVAGGMASRTIVQSFDIATLDAVRTLEPSIRVSFLNGESRPNVSALMTSMNVDIFSPHHRWITKDDVDAVHRIGKTVVPWTANTQADWDHLIALGVDGIITDDPAALIEYLKAKGLR